MAEWMSCPGCQLRHSRRPDGLCPRCKQPVDGAGADAAPVQAAAPPALRAGSYALPTPAAPFAGAVPAVPVASAGASLPSRASRSSLAGNTRPSPSAAPGVRLGNLAQAARGGELKNARRIMLFIGIMSLLANAFFYSQAEGAVQKEIDKELQKLGPNFVVDQAKLSALKNQAVRVTHLINVGGMMLGMVFIVCAMLVERHPVPMTITSLALYLGGNAIFGFIDPTSLAAGLIVKIVIVVALFKAVQAAIAYQKELAAAPGA